MDDPNMEGVILIKEDKRYALKMSQGFKGFLAKNTPLWNYLSNNLKFSP